MASIVSLGRPAQSLIRHALWLPAILAVAPMAAALSPDAFDLAGSRRSFGVQRELRPGEVLELSVTGLGESRRLHLYRCEADCETASSEATWDDSQFPPDGRLTFTVVAAGRYYFWIEDLGGEGLQGRRGMALLPEYVLREGETLRLGYGDGLEVLAEPVETDLAALMERLSPSSAAGRSARAEAQRSRPAEEADAARRSVERAKTPAERSEAYLGLADTLVRLEEYAEASKALDGFDAAGGKSALARDLRCWTDFAARTAGLLRSSGEVKAPVKVHSPQPQYTPRARKARVQGTVFLALLIDEKGHVACARALTELAEGLDTAAVEMAERWRFRPATLRGEPVAVTFDLTVNFSLQ